SPRHRPDARPRKRAMTVLDAAAHHTRSAARSGMAAPWTAVIVCGALGLILGTLLGDLGPVVGALAGAAFGLLARSRAAGLGGGCWSAVGTRLRTGRVACRARTWTRHHRRADALPRPRGLHAVAGCPARTDPRWLRRAQCPTRLAQVLAGSSGRERRPGRRR